MRAPRRNHWLAALIAVPAAAALASCTSAVHDPADLSSGVHLGPKAAHYPQGPFRISHVRCGALTDGQRSQFGTPARSGLTYWYENTSKNYVGAPSLSVDFLRGSMPVGSNVAGELGSVGPGGIAQGEVDARGLHGEAITFTDCNLMFYADRGPGGVSTGRYAP